jgi:hypothetical protein
VEPHTWLPPFIIVEGGSKGFHFKLLTKKNAFPLCVNTEGGSKGPHLKFLLEKNTFPSCLFIEGGTRDFTSNFSHKEELANKGLHHELLSQRTH